jgi:PEP-CTERM motif
MLKKLAILVLAGGSCLAMTAKADSTPVSSSAANTTNDSGSATQNIVGNSAWAAPIAGSSWISYGDTGDTSDPGFFAPVNGTAVTFSQTFTLNGPVTSAWLDVLADDTTSVWINGVEIASADLGGSYPTCASLPIGCLTGTEGIFNTSQLAPYLQDGTNTISFVVYQEGGSSYGVDYAGGVTTAPEPASLLMLGSGLIGLIGMGRRKLLQS